MQLNFNMKIIHDKKNELFKRQEMTLTAESNLSFDQAKKELATLTKKSEETIDVFGVKGKFGKKTFTISAHTYDTPQDLQAIKKLQSTSKQREEAKKAIAEAKKSSQTVAV